jgi:hypothetical protein
MVAAASFAICNVLSKLILAAGSDVLTLSLFRGLIGIAPASTALRDASAG